MNELAERRACAQMDARRPTRRTSSYPILCTRFAAFSRAWSARDEAATRDELRQLAEEALRLADTTPLWTGR